MLRFWGAPGEVRNGLATFLIRLNVRRALRVHFLGPLGSLLARKLFGFGRSKLYFLLYLDPFLTFFDLLLFDPNFDQVSIILLTILDQISDPLDSPKA